MDPISSQVCGSDSPGWDYSAHVVALGYSATHPGYLATADSADGTHSAQLIGDELSHVRLWMGSDPTAADFQSFKLSWNDTNKQYDLTVQAGNNLTGNPFTDGSIEEVFLVFQPPENVTVEVRDSKLRVNWTEADASAITYQVQYKKSADTAWITPSPAAQPVFDLGGLDNDVQYDVRVGLLIHGETNPYFAPLVQATPKAAPTSVTATAASLTSATVSWTNVAAATSHMVRYRERMADASWSTPSTQTSPHTVTGLTTGKTYQFQVAAVYGSGANALTSWSDAVAVTLSRKPQNVEVAAGNGSLTVTWMDAVAADSHSVRHRVTTAQNDSAWTTVESKTSGYEITGLTSNTEYDVQVGGVYTGDSNSPYWSATVKGTPASAPPGNVEAQAGDAKAKVFWDEVSGATSYSVRYRSSGGSWTTLTGQTGPIEISSLTNGTAYEVQVGAVDGTTQWSASVSVTPTAGLPGVPADVYLDTLASTSARLLWTDAELNFIAEHRLASSSAWTQTHADGQTNTVWTFSGLTAGEDYLLRIRAKTAAGTSASAGPATDPILVNVAKTPGNITRMAGDTKITVTWDDVTGASSYSVRHADTGTIAWTTETDKTSGHEVTGLANGMHYFVQVGAVVGGKTYWSATGSAVRPSLPLAEHSNLAVQPRDGGLYATWNHGNEGQANAPIANFYYRQGTTGNWNWWMSGACDTPGSALPFSEQDCNVTGLTNGTVYQVRVHVVGLGWDELIATGTPGPAPSAVTASAASATSLSIAWTNAAGATGHRLRHRATTAGNDGAWTVVTSPANPYTLSSLTTGTQYDIEVGADHGTSDGTSTLACDGQDACGTHWSATVKGTPLAAGVYLETTVTVEQASTLRGYWDQDAPSPDYGSIGTNTFILNGTTYTVKRLFQQLAGNAEDDRIRFATSPKLTAAELNELKFTVKTTVYEGGWTCGAVECLHDLGNMSWADGDMVAFKIEARPSAPKNVAAAPGDTKLTGHLDRCRRRRLASGALQAVHHQRLDRAQRQRVQRLRDHRPHQRHPVRHPGGRGVRHRRQRAHVLVCHPQGHPVGAGDPARHLDGHRRRRRRA